ncbi:MAG: oxidoreductase, partial [Candidatus Latescibacteria bacterium]|nr:oxidoreductase [Candidatus Latescibacterota bacterium]
MRAARSGSARIGLYLLLVLLPLAGAVLLNPAGGGFLTELGRSAALAGYMILLLQGVLASRWKWVERPFGLDMVLRFHRNIAVLAVLLLVAHPLLLAAGGRGWGLVLSLDLPWYIWAGKVALLLLLLNALSSLIRRRLGLSFERWRLVHDVVGPLLIVAGLVHGLYAGRDLGQGTLRACLIVVVGGAIAVFVHHRIVRPRLLRRKSYRVTEVATEAEGVWTVKLAPPEGESPYEYRPGQFHFLTFHRDRGLPEEEHHWTISSSPTEEGTVASTIKSLGDFTSTIGETRPGDRASVHAPFGRFSYTLHPGEDDLVFVAGGIGITPLMSMLRHMRDRGDPRKVLLLYGSPDEESIVFRDELEEIEAGRAPRL